MKKRIRILVIVASLLAAGLATTHYAWATPSAGLSETDDGVFDDWGISRTRSYGEDGFYQISETSFRPVIAFESLGEEADLAYRLGEQFAAEHPDRIECAEAIFHFVRDRVKYTSDVDQFGYEEFALNADELAGEINQNGASYGDCEDSAVLLAVIYRGAGYRSVIVLAPGHTAALVYLPEYKKATAVLELDGEVGWVWAEATGSNNPLGWIPKDFVNVELAAYEIGEETVAREQPATTPATAIAPQTTTRRSSPPVPFFAVMAFFWLIPLIRRLRRRRRIR
jgi:predicted transglutaminase-like cysteine proteinase